MNEPQVQKQKPQGDLPSYEQVLQQAARETLNTALVPVDPAQPLGFDEIAGYDPEKDGDYHGILYRTRQGDIYFRQTYDGSGRVIYEVLMARIAVDPETNEKSGDPVAVTYLSAFPLEFSLSLKEMGAKSLSPIPPGPDDPIEMKIPMCCRSMEEAIYGAAYLRTQEKIMEGVRHVSFIRLAQSHPDYNELP